jgi:hypothetical protein
LAVPNLVFKRDVHPGQQIERPAFGSLFTAGTQHWELLEAPMLWKGTLEAP